MSLCVHTRVKPTSSTLLRLGSFKNKPQRFMDAANNVGDYISLFHNTGYLSKWLLGALVRRTTPRTLPP
jgi:hypothetical protein